VPGVDGNVSVAAFTVHDAVMVIETAKFAVALPACAVAGGNSEAAMSAAVSSREVFSIFQFPCFPVKRRAQTSLLAVTDKPVLQKLAESRASGARNLLPHLVRKSLTARGSIKRFVAYFYKTANFYRDFPVIAF